MVIKYIKIFRISPIAFKSSLKKNIIVFLLAIFSLPIMTATADVSSLGKIFGAFNEEVEMGRDFCKTCTYGMTCNKAELVDRCMLYVPAGGVAGIWIEEEI